VVTFRAAVEARDIDAIESLLAEDVVFRSPVVFTPYQGRPITAAILRAVMEVFEGFGYVREIGAPGDRDHALVFEASVDGFELTGCDILHYDSDGLIDDFMVMVRPRKGMEALAARMAERFEQINADAGARSAG
jgi:SnoaL-like domain